MIPFTFDYYKAETPEEAAAAYAQLSRLGRNPVYFSGGTELISMGRAGTRKFCAVIDLKGVPECTEIKITENELLIGSAVTLSKISESRLFPLLGKAAGRIADHTNQCKITLGGNVCGTVLYRESVLPLLLCESTITVYGEYGIREVSLREVFHERLRLGTGEFALCFKIKKEYLSLPYLHVKRTKIEKIDYPLITLCALKKDGRIRAAFSGLCAFPFRSVHMEAALNDGSLSPERRAEKAASALPAAPLDDLWGSGEYRLFVLENMLTELSERLGEAE